MPASAKKKGSIRKRRRYREVRREATKSVREAYNDMMRRQGHPGWVSPDSSPTWRFYD